MLGVGNVGAVGKHAGAFLSRAATLKTVRVDGSTGAHAPHAPSHGSRDHHGTGSHRSNRRSSASKDEDKEEASSLPVGTASLRELELVCSCLRSRFGPSRLPLCGSARELLACCGELGLAALEEGYFYIRKVCICDSLEAAGTVIRSRHCDSSVCFLYTGCKFYWVAAG